MAQGHKRMTTSAMVVGSIPTRGKYFDKSYLRVAGLKPTSLGNRPSALTNKVYILVWSVSRRHGFESRCVQIFIRFLNKYFSFLSVE